MIKVFVYGGLMNRPAIKKNAQAAYLNNHRISFSIKGFVSIEPAFAELVAAPGEQAWGLLATITAEDWQLLKKFENSYNEKNFSVYTLDGKQQTCIALVRKEPTKNPERVPSARYMRILYINAKRYHFPKDIIERYKTLYYQGTRLTLFTPWLVPIFKLIRPWCGFKSSIYLSIISVPLLTIIAFALLGLHFM